MGKRKPVSDLCRLPYTSVFLYRGAACRLSAFTGPVQNEPIIKKEQQLKTPSCRMMILHEGVVVCGKKISAYAKAAATNHRNDGGRNDTIRGGKNTWIDRVSSIGTPGTISSNRSLPSNVLVVGEPKNSSRSENRREQIWIKTRVAPLTLCHSAYIPYFLHRSFLCCLYTLGRRIPIRSLKSQKSDSTGHFAGAEATGTDINVLGAAVHDRFHTLHIGLPGAVGAAVRVGNPDAEHNALVAKFTFGHSLEPPCCHFLKSTTYILTEKKRKSK